MFKMTGLYGFNRPSKTKRRGPKLRGGTEGTEKGGYSDDVMMLTSNYSICQVAHCEFATFVRS
jgi:hypothetical protein